MVARVTVPVLFAVLLANAAGAAASTCAPADPVRAPEVATAEVTEELILPCAAVEGDLLGPWCVEASFYLVTDRGTALCQVTLPALDLVVEASHEWRDGAGHDGASVGLTAWPTASLTTLWGPPRGPLVWNRSAPLPGYPDHQLRQPQEPAEVPG